jgi:glucose/arabinose dehydrogenase
MIITEKDGRIFLADQAGTKTPVTGGPEVLNFGQGGLMDVSVHPNFRRNGWIYFTVAQGTRDANHAVIARGKLVGTNLEGTEVIYRPNFKKPGGQHFGSRIQWMKDGTMLFSVGDGGNPPNAMNGKLTRYYVQDKDSNIGKLMRLDENGKPPKDNPFVGQSGWLADIWTLGHRNIQGLTMDPKSGRVWANEHGARGGDEVNEIVKGRNYGWPIVTFSMEYSGPKISDYTTLEGYEDPVVAWTPCPAPSGLQFFTGKVKEWQGDLFSGGLAGNDVRRIDLDSKFKSQGVTRFSMGARVRNVRQGPDGHLYVATEGQSGGIYRIER